MKAAILTCDHVPEELKTVHGSYFDMFNHILKGIDLNPFYVIDGQFPIPSDYDTFIITGSKFSVYDKIPWIDDLKLFTEKLYGLKKKLVGICFGHQMIAEALGGSVEKSVDGFLIGVHDFEIAVKKYWMQPEVSHYRILMSCQDQVQTLPPNSTLLAGSPFCPIGMFVVGDNFLGIQGHVEFSKAYNQALFESRVEKIGIEKIKNAISSFRDNPDQELLSGYIIKFIKGQ